MYRRKTDEKLLEELLGRGYGVDERKRRREKWLRSVEARNRIEKRRQRERQPQRTDRRSVPAVLGERASEDGVAVPADPRSRREEDALVRPSPRLRRRIDRYAYRNGYRITGPYERVMSFFTHFLPDIRDGVSWSLVEMLVRGRGYRVDNPAAYCLADNMDALYFSSRLLLGRQGHARPRQGAACASLQARIDGALRRKEPFAHAFLTLFARSDEQLRRSLDVILAMSRGGRRVGVGSLVRTVKYVYRLTLLLQDLDPAYMEETYRRIAENGRAYVSTSEARMQIEVALHRLRIAVSNLVEYRHQLFPALLKMLGTYFRGPNWEFFWSPSQWPAH